VGRTRGRPRRRGVRRGRGGPRPAAGGRRAALRLVPHARPAPACGRGRPARPERRPRRLVVPQPGPRTADPPATSAPPPARRPAATIVTGTRRAGYYGAGEVAVNSAHRRAVRRVACGFRVSARALDGVIEAIEPEGADWFALGLQWLPAAATTSGLDMPLFRG